MDTVITDRQQGVLEMLHNLKVCTTSGCDRSIFEALVNKGMAIKHSNGRQATYSITDKGESAFTERGN